MIEEINSVSKELRALAFLLTERSDESSKRAEKHLKTLANRFGHQFIQLHIQGMSLCLVSVDKMTINPASLGSLRINLGSCSDGLISPTDRYLSVEISSSEVRFFNDYAGTVPVYYSQRGGLVASNIEPCVVLASSTRYKDISYENLYGYFRYSHFIWEETAYKHINQFLPDSYYLYRKVDCCMVRQYRQTIVASDVRLNLNDKQVAHSLYELNHSLVTKALSQYEQINLPLSSGYDSRMIFAAAVNDKQLKDKLSCFTYGTPGALEVEAARELTRNIPDQWQYMDLPCRFLGRDFLDKIHDIFGGGLHMHGMYQLEVFDLISDGNGIPANACVTSGFMTGVPAGQHNGLLKINSGTKSLSGSMQAFAQSDYWSETELARLPAFEASDYGELAESRFRQAFNQYNGPIHQQSVMFDVWTRQRNFIGYYPRVFEWCCDIVSPHMTPDYQNFFFSLAPEHLYNRNAIELMFKYHYPDQARVISNSNGVKSLTSAKETALYNVAKLLRAIKLNRLLPQKYRSESFEFDIKALKASEDGFFPLFSKNESVSAFVEAMGGGLQLGTLASQAYSGDIKAYNKLAILQSIAGSLALISGGEA